MPSGINRKPVMPGPGVDSVAIRASVLSDEGASACETGGCAFIGSMPHARHERGRDARNGAARLG